MRWLKSGVYYYSVSCLVQHKAAVPACRYIIKKVLGDRWELRQWSEQSGKHVQIEADSDNGAPLFHRLRDAQGRADWLESKEVLADVKPDPSPAT